MLYGPHKLIVLRVDYEPADIRFLVFLWTTRWFNFGWQQSRKSEDKKNYIILNVNMIFSRIMI